MGGLTWTCDSVVVESAVHVNVSGETGRTERADLHLRIIILLSHVRILQHDVK